MARITPPAGALSKLVRAILNLLHVGKTMKALPAAPRRPQLPAAKPKPQLPAAKPKGRGRPPTHYNRSATESAADRAKRRAARDRLANSTKDPAGLPNNASTARARQEADKAAGRSPNFGDAVRKRYGDPPDYMERPHGHHVVEKDGGSTVRKQASRESASILEEFDIDWYTGPENLMWAPNRNHSNANAEALLERLKLAKDEALKLPLEERRQHIVDALQQAGREIFDAWP